MKSETITAQTCSLCGAPVKRMTEVQQHTIKQRRKFGFFFVLLSLTIVGFPIAILLWLTLPRKKVVIGTSQTTRDVCTQCRLEVPA